MCFNMFPSRGTIMDFHLLSYPYARKTIPLEIHAPFSKAWRPQSIFPQDRQT
jgi:hypothetical protein